MNVIATISRKEHKQPVEVEQWSLPEITLIYSTYYEEAQQMKEIEDQIKASQD